ncbi:hypothetical protein RRG08_023810 [Elysia crispata]|uniref:Uncharacterized protein n=1 Tax=Elysia crispata TaxID=231223 RepID=A0AAE1DP08_9GAST|nr:hypothetical protein RRG08_023810 [Elysia crispata]
MDNWCLHEGYYFVDRPGKPQAKMPHLSGFFIESIKSRPDCSRWSELQAEIVEKSLTTCLASNTGMGGSHHTYNSYISFRSQRKRKTTVFLLWIPRLFICCKEACRIWISLIHEPPEPRGSSYLSDPSMAVKGLGD